MIVELAYQGEKVNTPNALRVNQPQTSLNQFPLGFIGRNSYIVSASCENSLNFGGEHVYNVHVGNYSALAHQINFVIDINHDYSAVCTGNLGVIPSPPTTLPRKGQILIQNDVWVGRGATIMGGVTIHNGAVVAAGSVVTKDVEPYSIVGGNPARLIKYRFEPEVIDSLLKIQWWDWPTQKMLKNQQWFSKSTREFAEHFVREVSLDPAGDTEGTQEDPSIQHRFLYVPDFDEPFPTWTRVIPEFARTYAERSDCLLTLFVSSKKSSKNIVKKIEEQLKNVDSQAQLYIHFGAEEDLPGLMMRNDFYITDRSADTVRHSCMADRYHVKTLSGVDIPMFAPGLLTGETYKRN